MRSKEAFAYSRSTGYFCSVCNGSSSALPPSDAATGRSLSRRNGHGALSLNHMPDQPRQKTPPRDGHGPKTRSAAKANTQGSFGYLIQAAPGDVPRNTVASVRRAQQTTRAFFLLGLRRVHGGKEASSL